MHAQANITTSSAVNSPHVSACDKLTAMRPKN